MLNFLAPGIAILLFMFAGWFRQEPVVSAAITIPEKAKEGQEVPITIRITGLSGGGACTIELKLDEGMKVLDGENDGARFAANGDVVSWTWDQTPENTPLNITAALFLAERVATQKVEAVVHFESEGERKETEPVSRYVEVVSGQQSAVESSADIAATRLVESRGNECIVTVNIRKDATKGFARYSEELPPAWNVRAINKDGASFSVADGKIRFVWVSVPEKTDLQVSYAIKAPAGEKIRFRGEYSYIENNRNMTFELKDDSLVCRDIDALAAAPARKSTESKSPRAKKNDQAPDFSVQTKGVVFSVQIGAFKNRKVSVARLKKLYRLNEPIHSEMQDGLHKFFTGTHAEYRDAHDHRDRAKQKNGIATAFVIARNNGTRISVREALDITHQQWYK